MPKPPRTHVYTADSLPGDKDENVPCVCGLPKSNRAHTLPDTPADAVEIDKRRVR